MSTRGKKQHLPSAKRPDGDPRRDGFIESGEVLTTNQGVAISDNQNSLKAAPRGPTLLEDFILREKITHFDHERIPERVVHARGSAAHGVFRPYASMAEYTKAGFLQDPAIETEVFVRFSTVAGGAGSADTARDVRGFAVKFYTAEGNFDLVGNNIPVFFIQDAIKFPDLIHSVKPEPHHGMPQAASAHDTFWDFASLLPESTHMLMWAMSDRAIPRSYRMMEGFGVHSFKFVNAEGKVHFVKFHWKPKLGTHSLLWDEAQQISGKDPDFHRRDLWEAIEAGAYPEFEFGVQLIPAADVQGFPIDLLDPTKLVPEELVPVTPIGRMVLNRNPTNFFAETEQVAFHPGHLVPGIDFTNDPLLQGRLHSYLDTQLIRLGGPNFHEIPVNQPRGCPFRNLQRDGYMRQRVDQGRVAYEPSSLDEGAPAQSPAGRGGFATFLEGVEGEKVRARPESFFDHYSQAALFWRSQSPIEKDHIVDAFGFELGKVQTRHVQQRMVENLQNVDGTLARRVSEQLGLNLGEPPAVQAKSPVETSPALSLLHDPVTSAASRKVAILVADGVDGDELALLKTALEKAGAVAKVVGVRGGQIATGNGDPIAVDHPLPTVASTLFDAVAVPGGAGHVNALRANPRSAFFVAESFRHLKGIYAATGATALLEDAGVVHGEGTTQDIPGVVVPASGGTTPKDIQAFIEVIAKHRAWDRLRKQTTAASA
ncbi:MAG: catalase [Betaproteobacteria bacterium]|nr:catalase [Betaproteobacteria bacterium]